MLAIAIDLYGNIIAMPLGVLKSGLYRSPDPQIKGQRNHHAPGLTGFLGRRIPGTVINDQNINMKMKGTVPFFSRGQFPSGSSNITYLLDGTADIAALVESRDDD